jgi:hypothetical protein
LHVDKIDVVQALDLQARQQSRVVPDSGAACSTSAAGQRCGSSLKSKPPGAAGASQTHQNGGRNASDGHAGHKVAFQGAEAAPRKLHNSQSLLSHSRAPSLLDGFGSRSGAGTGGGLALDVTGGAQGPAPGASPPAAATSPTSQCSHASQRSGSKRQSAPNPSDTAGLGGGAADSASPSPSASPSASPPPSPTRRPPRRSRTLALCGVSELGADESARHGLPRDFADSQKFKATSYKV